MSSTPYQHHYASPNMQKQLKQIENAGKQSFASYATGQVTGAIKSVGSTLGSAARGVGSAISGAAEGVGEMGAYPYGKTEGGRRRRRGTRKAKRSTRRRAAKRTSRRSGSRKAKRSAGRRANRRH